MLDGKTLICGTRSGVTANVGEVKPIATANLGVSLFDKGELLELAIELKEANGTYANSSAGLGVPPRLPSETESHRRLPATTRRRAGRRTASSGRFTRTCGPMC